LHSALWFGSTLRYAYVEVITCLKIYHAFTATESFCCV